MRAGGGTGADNRLTMGAGRFVIGRQPSIIAGYCRRLRISERHAAETAWGDLAVRKLKIALASALALRSKEGVTAIEYGLIAGLIAVAIIAAVTLLGVDLTATFNMIAGELSNAASL